MIIVMKAGTEPGEISAYCEALKQRGFAVHCSVGTSQTVLGLVGDTSGLDAESIRASHLVEKVLRVQEPYKRANRKFHPDDSVISVVNGDGKESRLGGGYLGIIAGPCSVESREQVVDIARQVKKAGAGFLRGGAFKPRTSPYSFQGLGCEGLDLLLEAKKETGLPIVTELMATHQLELYEDVDIIQVGARNMQNYTLLKELGRSRKPILLKRGLAATVNELLMASEYIMAGGNDRIILCERGIRSFDSYTRNTLDLAAVPYLKRQSHLPVIVDPSHATGVNWMVPLMAKAAVAAGADGLIVEVHNDPENALCDGEQAITPAEFASLMKILSGYAALEGRKPGVSA
ncbi:MAG: 3-deoxy-7-phosphoheptulonate synthase [Spirochaetaceae bacterium]|jgi:3-deoxy-7-phosphoheptulonate synthase|nr:3-deoxy-7-phosphoheptulonate synthase [Spirochaetaceae bacterium]